MCHEIGNLMAHSQNPLFIKRCKVVLKYYIVKLMNISYVDIPVTPQVQINARTIESFNEFECYRRFRIRKIDLPTVYRLLNFPNVVTLDNGSKLAGVEVFLFSLNRFICPAKSMRPKMYSVRTNSESNIYLVVKCILIII